MVWAEWVVWAEWECNTVPYQNILKTKIKHYKKRVNYTINKNTIDRFKVVADKDMRKMSNIVENLIR